jgi:hypothetical protein
MASPYNPNISRSIVGQNFRDISVHHHLDIPFLWFVVYVGKSLFMLYAFGVTWI